VGNLSPGEIVILLGIALLVFGGKGLPDAARALGKGLREFRRALSDAERELHTPAARRSGDPPERRDEQPPPKRLLE
jgi:sec-independent protein translocase protein TatA